MRFEPAVSAINAVSPISTLRKINTNEKRIYDIFAGGPAGQNRRKCRNRTADIPTIPLNPTPKGTPWSTSNL